ncbi:MAG: LytR family transcriptional regulator [Synechococcus sp. SB0668_bin_15]|nr:LytR family transcriptional regulator [Synechococcus sp. SB0668_bin_15]MYC49386.1 LytR family transcriptional regulator [Synechococcus sp. SB0662_bin_14]
MFLRIVLRLGTFFVALLICSVALNRLWPRQADLLNRSEHGSRQEGTSPALKDPLMLLLMGLAPKDDEQQLPNVSGVLLVHLVPGQPVRFLQVPATTSVAVPGSGTVSLARAYNIGGVRLVAELLEQHLNRPETLVDRYILSSSPALAAFMDAMGGVPMTLDPPPQPLAQVTPPPVDTGTVVHVQDVQDGNRQASSPGAGPWAALGAGAKRLSGAQVETYLYTPGPAPGPAWQLERQRRFLGAMAHHLDSGALRRQWPRLAQDLLDASRTNLSREELFSVLAMLQTHPLRLVVEPLSPRAGAQAHFWPRSRPVPGDTVLVEGPLQAAMAFKQQLEARGTRAVVAPTSPDGVILTHTRLLAWGAEPPASVGSLLGTRGRRRQDAPSTDAAITVRLGTDWSRSP